jgi:hypothetical protein
VDVETYVVDFLVSGAAGGTPQRWRAGDRSLVVMSLVVLRAGVNEPSRFPACFPD